LLTRARFTFIYQHVVRRLLLTTRTKSTQHLVVNAKN
jgi:hypothetical protein